MPSVKAQGGKSRAGYFSSPKISSAEQSITLHSFAKVTSEGSIRPERYCDSVGLEIPSSAAIWLFDFQHDSISLRKFSLIVCSVASMPFIILGCA